MTMFDFQDGQGPVPAHQHPNGGGWVADTATVAETAYIGPNARVFGQAQVSGNARVFENARVFDKAQVSGNACVAGNAQVFENARVTEYACVAGNAQVSGDAWVFENALVYGKARVTEYVSVEGIVTKNPIVITGFPFTVTIEDKLINIGCKSMTFEEWKSDKGKQIFKEEGLFYLYKPFKKVAKQILKTRGK